jgi:hypothetical protein
MVDKWSGNYSKGVDIPSTPLPNAVGTFKKDYVNKRYIKERDRLFKAFGFGGRRFLKGDESGFKSGDTYCYDGEEYCATLIMTGNISVIGRLMKYFEDSDIVELNTGVIRGDRQYKADYEDLSSDEGLHKMMNGDGRVGLESENHIPVHASVSKSDVEALLSRAINNYGVIMFLSSLHKNDKVTFKHLVKLSNCALIEFFGYDIVGVLLNNSKFDFLDILLRGDESVESLELAIATFTHKSWENLILFNNILRRTELSYDIANILSYIRFDDLFRQAKLPIDNKVYEFYLFS